MASSDARLSSPCVWAFMLPWESQDATGVVVEHRGTGRRLEAVISRGEVDVFALPPTRGLLFQKSSHVGLLDFPSCQATTY